MLPFERKVDDFIKTNTLITKGDSVLIGVSGGPDSVALLHYLVQKRNIYNISIRAAHVDHMLRGKDSYNDLLFVQELCKQWNIPCEAIRINIQEKMGALNKGMEETARIYRYRFFQDIMEKYQHNKLLLGHHGDDQIETILMRLTRGSTGKGRAGIPLRRAFANGEIIRPLLCVTKKEIEEYCHIHDLSIRIDSSNFEQDYTRNRFRLNVLPFLKKENNHVHEHFQRFSEEILSDEAFLQELTLEKMNKLWNKMKNEVVIEIPSFIEMPLPLQRRGIQLILNYLYNENPSFVTAVHTDDILKLLLSNHPSGRLDLPLGLKVRRSYQQCTFSFIKENQNHTYEMKLSLNSEVDLPNGYCVRFLKGKVTENPSLQDQTCMYLEDIQLPLVIRNKKAGDRMKVKGLNGSKKVKDIFIDEKIPREKRDEWPIVVDQQGDVLWIPKLKKSSYDILPTFEQTCYILQYFKQTFS
ncbi:tRNA lysidine(34) synthetase TilS [Heyndrickxia oleronia]|jgi:tRNA(Ile)-lysidine synthetase-like protein|uniref:tRNA lysidine(34) synthetase TilS n=1 Tax=Heyndrickxia oleronia TaxID=38875 RepID=UPI001C0EB76C|nr:tRNA lysidine(34) synthetase TilS [Heyndrickxia oleronia]MBU5214790.1 tRNA lysidine(34) synthetase TilS [Heyndrickxia oleronia]MCI1591544.1 tRNA lysidine(34) synthetase TilS [Heyndrickxia oleronia]MCI1614844.1 tRNA lysidine(34) synthetase TilS [Heyndrickxia oleronia]MCI1745711.1 tRNA lysidine(34) synthetase TilS [Heyndrickxia oleronia]MCI1762816.1 tRNA lysidine(34) synthetase TilS [Heyndrickxia oleronia]